MSDTPTPYIPRPSPTTTDETDWLGVDPGRPAFEVRRAFYGGDFARGGSGGEPKNALRFPTVLPSEADLLKGEVLFNALPLDYESIQLQWGYPPQYLDDEGNIRQELLSRVLIARSSYGHPVAPQEGCIVYDQKLVSSGVYEGVKGTIVDQVLQQGRWYCYSLFFQTPTFRWLRVATAETLLPYDYHHRDFLWDRIPPFYQAVDRQYIPETQVGVLQRFLQVIGYELDYVRTLAEGTQEIYSADFVPPALNAAFVTQNLGLHWEGALGECNMRAFGANYSELTQQRGTQNGLSDLIHSTTKCDAIIRAGANRMLNPNDSEFVDHTGNWTLPLTAPFPLPGNAATQTSTVVPLRTLPATGGLPGGRGALRISGTASPVALNCGWGTDIKGTAAGGNLVPPRVLTPIYYGIPAAENETYGYLFSLYGIAVTGISYGFTWVEADGLTVISHIAASANLLLNTWTTFKMSATAPSGTKYVIPYLSIPALGPFYLAAVMVSEFVGAGSLGAFLPDIYLTMGDATETIGSDNAYLGEPK